MWKIRNVLHHRELFENSRIVGYDDLKDTIKRAIESDESYNILLNGPPATSKTLFLIEIVDFYKEKAIFFDGSNTTNRILDEMYDRRPTIIALDELEKMGRNYQEKMLNFMETGRVKVDQQKKIYDFEIKGAKIFATSNDLSKLSGPLKSRFNIYTLPEYTFEEFVQISARILPKQSKIAPEIAHAVWFKMNSRDIRDVIKVGKLARRDDGPDQIQQIIDTKLRYRGERS